MSGVNRRKEIRDELIDILKSGVPSVSQHVFGNRVRRLWADKIPCILVYTKDEPADREAATPGGMLRSLAIVVEVIAAADAALDDVLDDIAREVEDTLTGNDTLNGKVTDLELRGTQMDFKGEERQVGAAQLTYLARYFT